MSAPRKPTVYATGTPSTITLIITTADVGTTSRSYYRKIGTLIDVTGPTCAATGTIFINGLEPNATYLYWVVSDNGTDPPGEYSLPAIGSICLLETDSMLGALENLAALNNPLMDATPGGIWVGDHPESVPNPSNTGQMIPIPLPLIVIRDQGSTFDWSFEDTKLQTGTVTFHCFGKTCQVAEDVATKLQASLDWSNEMQFVNAMEISLQLTGYRVDPTQERSADNAIVFDAQCTYQVDIKRTYAN
jgi:hypothetical protein